MKSNKRARTLTGNDIPRNTEDILEFIKTDPEFQAEAKKLFEELFPGKTYIPPTDYKRNAK